ncbi:MAG TPA: hypothetical protein VIW25_03600 [Nitrososphaeraceae archaeon]
MITRNLHGLPVNVFVGNFLQEIGIIISPTILLLGRLIQLGNVSVIEVLSIAVYTAEEVGSFSRKIILKVSFIV